MKKTYNVQEMHLLNIIIMIYFHTVPFKSISQSALHLKDTRIVEKQLSRGYTNYIKINQVRN